jgi:hypothetical protein
MYVRTKRSDRKGTAYEYLQIVRSYREGGKVRQQVVASLGRKETLLASGELDGLLQSLAKYSDKLRVVEAVRTSGLAARTAKSWGPALVFGRLWQNQGLPDLLGTLAQDRKFTFSMERTCFAMALQRLCAPGADLAGAEWVKTIEAPGFEDLALQHFYRATAFLAGVREELESRLFHRDLNLFNQTLDIVFLDTTSLYVYTETDWRKRGYSRDHRPDLLQFVLCVAVNAQGWPIAWEIFPGNTADQQALRQIIAGLRQRFRLRQVTVVADRGMISKDTLKLLTEDDQAPFDYVLGCRMRRQKEVNETVLARGGRYQPVAPNLEVKEVRVGNKRYVVCRNPQEAVKDAAVREAILEKLRETVAKPGPKAVIGNRGYARFLKVAKGSVTIDEVAVKRDARLDGKFVLTTNTELPTAEVAQTYKSLWRVERTFREQKSTLEVRPIYHHRDDTAIGHIVASFLALRLEVDLQRRLEERAAKVSWSDMMRDLGQVQAVLLDLDGNRYQLRTDMLGSAHQAFAAAGVRPPPPVKLLGPIS